MEDVARSPHAQRASLTYSAAADHYDLPALSFWHRFGEQTIRRAGVQPGDHVVDLCCGSGASALAAARATGPHGRVLGVDVAEGLLALAREKAAREGLENVQFVHRDATATGLVSEGANVVVCVFGVFFAPDMAAFVAEMWRLVTPGGCLAVTTWGPSLFEPGNSIFWDSVREVEPSLYKAFNPWDSLTRTQPVLDLFSAVGAGVPVIDAVAGRQQLDRPSDFWQVVMGSGYRNTVDALQPVRRSSLRNIVIQRLEAEAVHDITVDVLYAVSRKPLSLPPAKPA